MPKYAETRVNIEGQIERKCTTCDEFKPLAAYRQRVGKHLGTIAECLECERAAARDRKGSYYEQNKEKILQTNRIYVLRTKYGLTKEEFDKLAQNGCMICGSMEKLSVDHHHGTGVIRGILCHKCNVAIGLLDEDIERISKVIEYLTNEHRKAAVL